MEYFGMLGITSPVVIIGIITFFIVAIVQEGKGHERGVAIRQAFTTIIVLVMLTISVVSVLTLGQLVLRQWVFPDAPPTNDSFESGIPQPEPYVSAKSAAPIAALTCTEKCHFTADEVLGVRSWLSAYGDWKGASGSMFSLAWKRNAVSAISFLLVALPLYLFFARLMNRDASPESPEGKGKPAPLRSIYFYLVAFSSLVAAVICAALLINVGLKAGLGISNNQLMNSYPLYGSSNGYVTSIESCAEKCGFTPAEVQMAKEWLTDQQAWSEQLAGKGSSRTQGDLATTIPILLVTAPLFWYHFARIRRESQEAKGSTPPTASST